MPIIKNVTFSNCEAGIKMDGGHLYTENVKFDNVTTPFDLRNVARGGITGSRVINDPKFRLDKSAVSRSSGWRRPQGPRLPIFCPTCKSISPSKNYVFGGMYFECWNNEETCPECGVFGARLSEGLFDLAGEAAKVISAPDITYAMLQAIADAMEDFRTGEASAEETVAKVASISPRLGQIVAKANKIGQCAILYLGFALAVAGAHWAERSMELAQEQVDLAKQQMALPNESEAKQQRTLEQIPEALAHLRVVPDRGNDPRQPQERRESHPDQPAQNEAPPEARAPHLGSDGTGHHAKAHGNAPPVPARRPATDTSTS